MDDADAPSPLIVLPPALQAADGSFVHFVWLWNWLQFRGTPDLHTGIAGWLDGAHERHRRELLLMVFRDAGKSTLVGLYCAWLLFKDPDLRILVISADHDLACKMTRNVRTVRQLHPHTAPRLVPAPCLHRPGG